VLSYQILVFPQPAPPGAVPHNASFEKRPWYFDEKQSPAVSLKGKVAIVTGSSSGIGKAAAFALYKLGCTVIVTSRNKNRAEAAGQWIADAATEAGLAADKHGVVETKALDLSDLDDVRRFAAEFLESHTKLHFLSENAGMGPLGFGWNGPWVSAQGYEMLYASNYLGHFLLLNLLTPTLKSSSGRVVATSSIMHWLHDADLGTLFPTAQQKSNEQQSIPGSFRQYGNTKLLQVLMCFEMQRRTPGVPCTPVAPGLIGTAIGSADRNGLDRYLPLGKSPDMGALTTLHALLSAEHAASAGSSGVFLQPYYSPPHQSPPASGWIVPLWEPISQHFTWALHRWIAHPDAYDQNLARRVWDASLAACGLAVS
jgi:NAD(P)-dependent dehydrogenase (short-subunit alcohol dehydrogenase family)